MLTTLPVMRSLQEIGAADIPDGGCGACPEPPKPRTVNSPSVATNTLPLATTGTTLFPLLASWNENSCGRVPPSGSALNAYSD
jgi:hypothetical protein